MPSGWEGGGMTYNPDYTSRVNILNTDPLVATFTFETDYFKTVVRVSYDREIRKYWTQARYHAADAANSIADINTAALARAIHDETLQKFADLLGSKGISVDSCYGDLVVYADHESALMSHKDLRQFALHIILEFDTRYVPTLEEVEREVVTGFRKIGEAA